MIYPISRKIVAVFLMLAFTLTIVMPGWAAMTYGREKLKGDSKTEGDFNLDSRCKAGQVACGTACVNVQTDSRNCGACGAVCPKGKPCSDGICGAPVSKAKIKQHPANFK